MSLDQLLSHWRAEPEIGGNIVNNFFYEKLTDVPTIKEYIEGLG
jgi:hypothetical protein